MAYNGKDLEILKEIVSRIQISAQIILSDGRKGWIQNGYEPEHNADGCAIAGINVSFENEDFEYQIRSGNGWYLRGHGSDWFRTCMVEN